MSIAKSIASIFGSPSAVALVPELLGGTLLAGLNTAAQTAIKAAVTEVNDGLDHLSAAFHTFETANPLVQSALASITTLAPQLGLTALPTEAELLTHIKAAIAELAAIFGVTAKPGA